MDNCPVCRSVITASRSTCRSCGTPLQRTLGSPISWNRKLTLLLPGLNHLWRGYVVRGILGLFGSFALLIWLMTGLGSGDTSFKLALKLLVWGTLWLGWSFAWFWDNQRLIGSKSVSPGQVASTIIILMMIANGLMFVVVLTLVFGEPYAGF